MNGPAFVIPCFKDPDICYYVERKFFDRSGWMDSSIINNQTPNDPIIIPDATTNDTINNYFSTIRPPRSKSGHIHNNKLEREEIAENDGDDEEEEDN